MSLNKMTFNGVSVFQVLADVRQGVESNLNKGDSLLLSGTHMSKADLLTAVAALQQPSLDVEVARREYESKLLARDAAAPAIGLFLSRYEAGVNSKVSSDPQVLAKYGIPAPKAKRTLTVEEKHAQLMKMRATRKVRGTLGRRQRKQQAKGVVEAPATTAAPTAVSASAPLALVPAATNGAAH